MLIAALLELKSRLLLPGEEEELIELDPGEAAEELLARLLDAHRYRAAASYLARAAGIASPATASARRRCRRSCAGPRSRTPARSTTRRRWPRRSATCSRLPEPVDVRHMARPEGVGRRAAHPPARACCAAGSFTFDEAVARADRVTVAVTLFAVLELYKQGELTWTQERPFDEIRDRGAAAGAARAERLSA